MNELPTSIDVRCPNCQADMTLEVKWVDSVSVIGNLEGIDYVKPKISVYVADSTHICAQRDPNAEPAEPTPEPTPEPEPEPTPEEPVVEPEPTPEEPEPVAARERLQSRSTR